MVSNKNIFIFSLSLSLLYYGVLLVVLHTKMVVGDRSGRVAEQRVRARACDHNGEEGGRLSVAIRLRESQLRFFWSHDLHIRVRRRASADHSVVAAGTGAAHAVQLVLPIRADNDVAGSLALRGDRGDRVDERAHLLVLLHVVVHFAEHPHHRGEHEELTCIGGECVDRRGHQIACEQGYRPDQHPDPRVEARCMHDIGVKRAVVPELETDEERQEHEHERGQDRKDHVGR